jgi:hypothetical protein
MTQIEIAKIRIETLEWLCKHCDPLPNAVWLYIREWIAEIKEAHGLEGE